VAEIWQNWPAEISQVSNAPGLDGVVNLFLFLVE